MYVAFPVCPPITNPDQIFIGIIFRDLRGECHHLPCRCMRRHIGVAQVYVVLLDRHDTVHHLLHRCALFTFFGTPLPVNDKFLRYRGIAHHQFALYQILNLFYRDILPIDGSGNLGRNLFNRGLVVVHTVGTIGLSDSPLDFLNREVLFGSITFRNGNTCIVRKRLPDIQKQILYQWPVSTDFHRNYSSGTVRDSHPIPFLSIVPHSDNRTEMRV